MNDQKLQNDFITGTVPENLEGFYKGEFAAFFPNSIAETMGAVLLRLWLPWKGKFFYSEKQVGDNILPSYLINYLRFRFNDYNSTPSPDKLFHAFPFATYVMNGVQDTIAVMRLSYDLPQNPPFVRKISDELVQLSDGSYLGKGFIQERAVNRLFCYFRLKK